MNMKEKERMYVKQQELQVGVHETDADGSTLGPVVWQSTSSDSSSPTSTHSQWVAKAPVEVAGVMFCDSYLSCNTSECIWELLHSDDFAELNCCLQVLFEGELGEEDGWNKSLVGLWEEQALLIEGNRQ